MLRANCLQVFPPFSFFFNGTVKPWYGQTTGPALVGDRGRIEQRAVRCSTRPSAGSLQPGNRSIGPARTARCSTPGSSQDGAVQHTGLQQTERKRAMVSAHARAHTRTAGTTGIPWMFCMFCMHCSTRPSAGTFQPRNSARAHQHGHIYTHARAHTHTTGTTGLTQ